MEFGIWSNGFRPHTSAAKSYEEDIYEIVLADKLGFRDCYISEHHGEKPYIGTVDTIPMPELMMAKVAATTDRIRMGSAVKLAHLQHPVDAAIQYAVLDHLTGGGRIIFGYGSGFSNPLFCVERGLTFEDRHERLAESLEFIRKCWETDQPFDWNGKYWKGEGIIALPKPMNGPRSIPMATATETEATIRQAGEDGTTLLSAFLDPVDRLRHKAEIYAEGAAKRGVANPRENISASRLVYIADSLDEAIADLREAVAFEVSIQEKRGFLAMMKNIFGLDIPNSDKAIDAYVETGFYVIGDTASVTKQLSDFYEQSGGFGTMLIVTGKDWATREKRARSMTTFMEKVAPALRELG